MPDDDDTVRWPSVPTILSDTADIMEFPRTRRVTSNNTLDCLRTSMVWVSQHTQSRWLPRGHWSSWRIPARIGLPTSSIHFTTRLSMQEMKVSARILRGVNLLQWLRRCQTSPPYTPHYLGFGITMWLRTSNRSLSPRIQTSVNIFGEYTGPQAVLFPPRPRMAMFTAFPLDHHVGLQHGWSCPPNLAGREVDLTTKLQYIYTSLFESPSAPRGLVPPFTNMKRFTRAGEAISGCMNPITRTKFQDQMRDPCIGLGLDLSEPYTGASMWIQGRLSKSK